jgi:alpha-tubulin suppressor-like RCC1 family protein
MVRLKVAVAVTAGALAGGLAVPSAASADTAQVVYAWGFNSWGQAGADPNVAGTDLLSPVPVHGAAANVTQLSGPNGPYKGRYVLSLRSDGTVWGWGRNYIGVLGDVGGGFAPVQIHGLPPGIVQISAGGIHAAALAADGSVWTWGGNNVGQLGYATPGAQYSTVPHQVPGVSGVRQIAAGGTSPWRCDPTARCGPGAVTPTGSSATAPTPAAPPRPATRPATA